MSHSKIITILGSTGSIGESSVKLLKLHQDKFQVAALTANSNVAKLAAQAKELNAKLAVIADEALYNELKSALAGTNIAVAAGRQAVIEAAEIESDIVIAAIVGSAGLPPTMAAIKKGKIIALANKECLVCAGDIVMAEAKKHSAKIIPVDSEHSAIFQIIDLQRPETIEKIILTASGGPFRNFSKKQMQNVTVADALKHPIWNMGAKISIDSATMMNKGLEIIEAWHLFPVSEPQIEVLIHPESVIHSMVSYIDGSTLAQLGTPDMSTPIAVALAYPERIKSCSDKLDFSKISMLNFALPDLERFPALQLARSALKAGGNAPAILNAANEVAVARFLNNEIGFLDIVRITSETLAKISNTPLNSIEEVLAIDSQSRQIAASF